MYYAFMSSIWIIEYMYWIGTKNVVKAVKKVAQGPAKDEGKTWFIQLKDKRK